jgi:hypothetical protein
MEVMRISDDAEKEKNLIDLPQSLESRVSQYSKATEVFCLTKMFNNGKIKKKKSSGFFFCKPRFSGE